jgi:hypothetical protein
MIPAQLISCPFEWSHASSDPKRASASHHSLFNTVCRLSTNHPFCLPSCFLLHQYCRCRQPLALAEKNVVCRTSVRLLGLVSLWVCWLSRSRARCYVHKRCRWMRQANDVTHMWETRTTEFCLGTPELKKPLRSFIHRWEINVIVNLIEVGWEVVEWIYLAQVWDHWRPLQTTGIICLVL